MQEILKVMNVTKNFGGLTALDDVNVTLKDKEILGLIGPNGAGKTTLINVIVGFYRPEKGKVFFNGEDITDSPPHTKAFKGVARTFQLTKPFSNISVFDNVMIGALLRTDSLSAAREKTMKSLERTGLKEVSGVISKGLPTGVKKRLEIARVLAMEPKVLCLDEVLTGLTPVEMDEILDLIRSLRKDEGLSIMIVEHVVKALMKGADRIVVLSSGKVIAEGPPKSVAKNPLVKEVYLGRS